VPLGSVLKNKWVPGGKPRLISDFKAADHNNNTTPNPFTGVYFQAIHLVQLILTLGAGCYIIQFDVKSAYRTLSNSPKDLHLQVSWLLNALGEKAFFVDLRNPFGQIEAENNFQVMGGLLEWIFHNLGAVFCRRYVDNFYDGVPPHNGAPDHETASRRASWWKYVLRALDVPYHEFQFGTQFPALGWLWDTVASRCP
jgi:hypothetical protein